MKPSVIVWDLETVPDLGGFAAANDLVGKSDVEVREAIGDKFPIAQFFAAQPRLNADIASAGNASYFVSTRLGAVLGVCSAGDMTKVTQAFQPSGRLSWANSQ